MIYLSGPMHGLSVSEAGDWRRDARAHFLRAGIESFDPVTDEPFIHEKPDCNQVITRDLNALQRSRLCFVRADRPSFGTPMEIFYFAHTLRRSVVVWAPKEFHSAHWLACFASCLTDDWTTAISQAVYLHGVSRPSMR